MIRSQKVSYWVYALLALGLSGWILLISLSRMSLTVLAEQSSCESVRNTPIALNTLADNTTSVYKLPTASMLPTHPFYGFKVIRDFFWVNFSVGDLKKSEISLLIADKKMAEMYALIEKGSSVKAMEAAEDGFSWLSKSKMYLQKAELSGRKDSLILDINRSGLAYRQMVESLSKMIDLNIEKYAKLVARLDEWNEIQKEELEKNSL